MFRILLSAIVTLCLVIAVADCPAQDDAQPKAGAAAPGKAGAQADTAATVSTADREALAPLQAFVGDWRGVGQLRRGSNQGAWIESSQWAWKFSLDDSAENASRERRASLSFAAPEAKYLKSGDLRPGKSPDEFELQALGSDGKSIVYRGSVDGEGPLEKADRFVLTADGDAGEAPARISIKLVADGDRLVALYERKSAIGDSFVRLAEVGYTRVGSKFGQGVNYVECVVTGGQGTIPVSYEGKTYYVCCTGCRDLFNDDPAGVLAEFQARKEEEKKERD